jgi:tRNA threonylcarbamoyladenosine modification (KEOPS) complex  Pcc1 subunit
LEARVKLAYKSVREARAVAEAVTPDNSKVPAGLSIKTTRKGKTVLTHIMCETKLQTFMSTIDDLLESVSVAENAFNVAKSQS